MYHGRKGAVQRAFVHKGEELLDDNDEMIQVNREKVEAVYDEIGDWLGLRG